MGKNDKGNSPAGYHKSGVQGVRHVIHEFSVYGDYTTTLYLKRNMAGGEKKRVSEIDSEMIRERLRRMEERMHGPIDREQLEPIAFSDEPTSLEFQYKELTKQENPIVGQQVKNAEYEGEMEEEVEEKTSGYLYLLYRNGKGEEKTLSQLGLLRKIKDAVQNNQEITKGKIIYNNQETGISVVYDKNGNYFRIEDTTRPRGRNYLDINGNDMNNEIVNEKTRGRSRADYQRVTHFNNSDE